MSERRTLADDLKDSGYSGKIYFDNHSGVFYKIKSLMINPSSTSNSLLGVQAIRYKWNLQAHCFDEEEAGPYLSRLFDTLSFNTKELPTIPPSQTKPKYTETPNSTD